MIRRSNLIQYFYQEYPCLMPHIPRENHHSMYVLHKIASPVIKICIVMQWNERKPKAFSKPLHNYAFSLQKRAFCRWKKSRLCENFATSRIKKSRACFNKVFVCEIYPWQNTFSVSYFDFLKCQKFSYYLGEIFSPFFYIHSNRLNIKKPM